jgi:hypothetical protein
MPFLPNPYEPFCVTHPPQVLRPDVVLRVADATHFNQLTGVTFKDDAGNLHAAPAGLTSDLASVPPFLWGVLASYGHQLRPALIHDKLCDDAVEQPNRQLQVSERRKADDVFRQALRDSGVALVRRRIFWAGVSFGLYLAFRKVALFFVILLAMASTAALVATAIYPLAPLTPSWRPYVLAWPILCLAAPVFFGKDYLFVLIVALVAPLIVPLALLTLIVDSVFYLLDGALYLMKIGTTPPVFPPTLKEWH